MRVASCPSVRPAERIVARSGRRPVSSSAARSSATTPARAVLSSVPSMSHSRTVVTPRPRRREDARAEGEPLRLLPVVRVVDREALDRPGHSHASTRSPAIEPASATRVHAISRLESWTWIPGRSWYWRECIGTSPAGDASRGRIVAPSTTHILPGCSRHSRTARSESAASPCSTSRSNAARIVSGRRNGLVGRRIENTSGSGPAAASRSSACRTHSMSGDVVPASAAGRSAGTSAP